MRSALFVDFDNVFIGLQQQDEALARTFATNPLQWVGWMEQSLPGHEGFDGDPRRRILARRCYLNPKSFGDYRPYFIRGAFETVDCPVLTTYGKTSADVHMVLDILDLLNHEVRVDEVILMSADADFTPVLLKLRRWDLRTVVVAVGPSAAAYRAAADIVVDQDLFVEKALTQQGGERVRRPAQQPPARQRPAAPAKPAPASAPAAPPPAAPERDPHSACLHELLGQAAESVPMSTLAAAFRERFPEFSEDWGGHGSFKQFLFGLDLSGLEISNVAPGYIYDPARHTPPRDGVPEYEETFKAKHPDIEPLARKISVLTDTPFLLPEHYAILLRAVAEETGPEYESMNEMAKKVRDKCRDAGIPIGRQAINFILRGITFTGHRFSKTADQPPRLADLFIQNTQTLCSSAQFNLSDKEVRTLKAWVKHAL